MSACLARSRHCAISRAICALNSAGVPPTGSTASLSKRACTSGRVDRALRRGGELVDHRLRRAGRRHDAHPEIALEARHALHHGRHVGELLQALGAGDGERIQLACRR